MSDLTTYRIVEGQITYEQTALLMTAYGVRIIPDTRLQDIADTILRHPYLADLTPVQVRGVHEAVDDALEEDT
jgi:hypothetical protein